MPEEHAEHRWPFYCRLLLQVGLGALYVALGIAVMLHLLGFSLASVPGNTDAWVGFWGNVVGGILGLVGGVSAAVVAIYVLRQQIRNDAAVRRDALKDTISDLAVALHSACAVNRNNYAAALESLRGDSLRGVMAAIQPALHILEPLDAPIVAQIATLSTSIAIRLREMELQVVLAKRSAEYTNQMILKGQTDGVARRIGLGLAGNLSGDIAKIMLSTTHYARGLIKAASVAGFPLPRENEIQALVQEYDGWIAAFVAESHRLNHVMNLRPA